MIKPPKKPGSLLNRLVIPITAVMLIQEIVFVSSVSWGGTLQQMNQNAMEILEERTLSIQGNLQNEMLQHWSNIGGSVAIVNNRILKLMEEEQADCSELTANSELSIRALNQVSGELLKLLQYSAVSDIFLIFDGAGDSLKTGLYLRDANPLSNPTDNSDVLIERGPVELMRRLNIPMDIGWEPVFHLDSEDSYYYEPMATAQAYPGREASSLGYWAKPFCLSEKSGTEAMTFSMPLLDGSGAPYAVMGVGLESSYLEKKVLSQNRTSRQGEVYLLAEGVEADDGTMEYQVLLKAGSHYARIFGDGSTLSAAPQAEYSNVYSFTISGSEKNRLYGSVAPLNLYDNEMAVQSENWYVIGLEEQSTLFGFSRGIILRMVIIWAFSLLLGVICLVFVGRHLVRPVTALSNRLRESNPHGPIKLEKVNIREIDQLAGAVEQMSESLAENSAKLSQIISMTDTILGAYEHKAGSDTVFCTEGFFKGFGLDSGVEDMYIQADEFKKRMMGLLDYRESHDPEMGTVIFRLHTPDGVLRWIQLKHIEEDGLALGVATDVTGIVIEKKKLEYERDYDPLTNLLNRRSFHRRAEERLADREQAGLGFLLMIDLDNLKYVNDTYGHDCGDQYIRGAASVLEDISHEGALAARVSGDEFYLLVTGGSSRKELLRQMRRMQKQFSLAKILLPDGQSFRVRASAGVAWYPDDSSNLDELIRFADFAMYEAKRSDKGALREFDREAYERDSILLYGKEMLNKLIDNQLVRYAFQPIVEVATGKAHGYELLMRPQLEELKNPLDVLRLARSQSRLYDIERMTWFCAMQSVRDQEDKLGDCYHFINSIPNQALTPDDLREFDGRFRGLLDKTVIELTEDEQNSQYCTAQKQQRCRMHNQRIALDDFGSGHNSESALLDIQPNYVKLDVSMIRGIDRDASRQQLVDNMVNYLKQRKIFSIAEGVETYEEMEWLVRCGVDYMQGYYFGRPDFAVCPPDPAACASLAEVREKLEQEK